MNYSNAYVGIKKLIAAEILSFISVILAWIAAIIAEYVVVSLQTANSGDIRMGESEVLLALLSLLFIIICALLYLITFIKMLRGLLRAKEDEPQFNRALFWTVAGMISTIIAPILDSMKLVIGSMLAACSYIFVFMIMLGMFGGIAAICEKLGEERLPVLMGKYKKILIGVVVILILGRIARFVGQLLLGQSFIRSAFGFVTGIICPMFQFIFYICVLIILSRTRKILAPLQQ